jgi:DNA topoisomerase-1
MAVFGEPALKENTKVQLDVNGHKFFLRGNRIRKKGWMEYYAPYIRFKVVNFPPVEEGDRFCLRWIKCEEKFTCPPCRYNPSSLLNKMEKLGIGTKTTRADIIQNLYNRGYVRDERIVVTELGFIIIDILETFAPAVTSIKLTQELEDKMNQVKNNLINRENVITDVIEKLRQLLLNFKENEKTIGRVLSKATKKGQVKKQIVGKCPNCNTGDLIIISSRKTGKRFIGCTNYFKRICSTSFPLPQKGAIKPAKSKCKACGWPQVLVWIGHRKPWKLCFNPNCSFKKKMKRKN